MRPFSKFNLWNKIKNNTWFLLLIDEVKIRLLLHKLPKYTKTYDISICAIFKDEAPFLAEWIEMNNIVGVHHFYLYNNNSSDNYLSVLAPYIDKGLVTLIDFPYDHAQMKAYEQFYNNYRNETQWVSFLDIDEFLVPLSHLTLQQWIKAYEKYPVIQIYWKMFGTSGLMKHDYNKLVTEQYHVCWKNLYHCGKCIINTDYDIDFTQPSPHHCPMITYTYLGKEFKLHPINIFHRSTLGEGTFFKAEESNPTIQINHYWSKAWDIYDSKRKKTDVAFERNPKLDFSYFLKHENENNSVDYGIYRFLIQLKLRIAGKFSTVTNE